MPRPDVSEERKQQILDAAAIVFSQQGFASARMDDIVKQSGLSKGALYWYFKSKDDIIIALMHRFFGQDMDEMNHLVQSEKPVREIMLMYVERLTRTYQEVISLLPLMYEYYALATRDDDKRVFFQNYFQQYRDVIHRLIERGIADGEFKEVDANAFTLMLVAQIEGTLLLNTINIEIPELVKQMTLSFSLLFDSIQAE